MWVWLWVRTGNGLKINNWIFKKEKVNWLNKNKRMNETISKNS